MDLIDLLRNKIEFGSQAYQQTTTVDSWAYWEYETYVDLLVEKNEKRKREEEAASKSQNEGIGSKGYNVSSIMNKMKSSIPKFK